MIEDWPSTPEQAVELQIRLAPLVDPHPPAGFRPRTAAGLDVAYDERSDRLFAAVVVLDLASLETVDQAVVPGVTDFPYVPGLFAFRELPALLAALERLTVSPDLLVCDGQGVAHPRRFGLASHLGVVTGLPSIGVAKTPMGHYEAPGPDRGDWTPMTDGTDVVGRALRTQREIKPLFVSIGHRTDLDRACAQVLKLAPHYRQPETTRRADHLCREALKSGS
ncbi:endonuclease V [Kutzneria sp. CA-103260]|uniref:endonuclease V n=1 Tax=Kutzneria sp. CA-103260 TaxID=2802641 RepID=UPI001BA78407|nr:endonuclease V [Kutzneria sp. CA-103260]QUQ70816.1 endonuclease V [Kutzneria sp. CA-103260]